jgi:aspartyl-tRNA(Asn)/glutamyl-tRNA(Gln) amidotransferase subunit C
MTIEDLKETAALAHLTLDEKELAAMFPAFEQMLEYFSMMQTAEDDKLAFPEGLCSELTDVPNNSRVVNSGFFRPDTVGLSPDSEKFINNAGGRDGQFIVIPNVL